MPRAFRFCPCCATPLETRPVDGRQRKACPADGCDFVEWGNPTPVAAVLPQLSDRIVLARNRDWPPGVLGLVTGFIEGGEEPADAAARELKEELGLEAVRTSLIGVYGIAQANQLLVAYHVEAAGEIQLNDEIAETKLVAVDRLKAWSFGTGLAVRDWLARR